MRGCGRLDAVYAAPDLFLGGADTELVALAERRGAEIVELGAPAFRSISTGGRPDGLLAVVDRWATALAVSAARTARRCCSSPRASSARGTSARSCAPRARRARRGSSPATRATDVFHPDAVRGAVGTLFHLPVAECAAEEALPWLRQHDARGSSSRRPRASGTCWDAPLAGPVAVVVGSERHGVSRGRGSRPRTSRFSIPMPGPADSLNVAVAAGIVLFEAVRQRRRRVTRA